MSALGDVIVDALQELLRVIFSPITNVIESYGGAVVRTVVGTPHPNAVFGQPTNGPWPDIYTYYWETIIPLSLFLWALSIGLVIFFESTSHLFSGYHQSKLKRRAFAGLLGLLSWWWLAALSLRFIEALTGFLVPNLSSVTLFQTLSFNTMGVLGLVIALSVNFILFVLVGVIYLMRQVVLYLFVLLGPLLIVFWIPGVGPFGLVSRFVKRLAGFYVPFLFMTVPVALLFRLGDLLGSGFGLSPVGVGAWLTGLVLPIVAVLSPIVLFWQAGALFFVADRAARHVSGQQARRRATRTAEAGEAGVHRGRNFARGVRGHGAIQGDGTRTFGSGESRANAAGLRLRGKAKELRGQLSTRVTTDTGSPPDTGRNSDFEALRGRTDRSSRRDQSAGTRSRGREDISPDRPVGDQRGRGGGRDTAADNTSRRTDRE